MESTWPSSNWIIVRSVEPALTHCQPAREARIYDTHKKHHKIIVIIELSQTRTRSIALDFLSKSNNLSLRHKKSSSIDSRRVVLKPLKSNSAPCRAALLSCCELGTWVVIIEFWKGTRERVYEVFTLSGENRRNLTFTCAISAKRAISRRLLLFFRRSLLTSQLNENVFISKKLSWLSYTQARRVREREAVCSTRERCDREEITGNQVAVA